MRLHQLHRKRLTLQIAIEEREAICGHRSMIVAHKIGPREMPRAIELDAVFRSRSFVVCAAPLDYERCESDVARAALIHDWRVNAAKSPVHDERLGVGRKREDSFDSPVLPAWPGAADSHHRVSPERVTREPDSLPINLCAEVTARLERGEQVLDIVLPICISLIAPIARPAEWDLGPACPKTQVAASEVAMIGREDRVAVGGERLHQKD